MLQQLLQEIKATPGPINSAELARRLGIEQSALAGMIDFWVRKGRLNVEAEEVESPTVVCSGAACAGSCPGPRSCPFVMQMPRRFSLSEREHSG